MSGGRVTWAFQGGGGEGGNLKGPPKFTKGGPQKVELKKKYLEGFLYRQWYENFLDLNFAGICPKKCVFNFIGICTGKFFEP